VWENEAYVRFNGERGKDMKKLLLICGVMLALLIPIAVFGQEHENGYENEYEEDPIIVLTFDEALAYVLEDIPFLIDLENRIYDLEEEIYDLNVEYRRIRWQTSTDILNRMRSQRTELDRQLEYLYLDLDILVLRNEQALRSALLNIINVALDIETAEASLIITAEQLRRAEILHNFGLNSANDVRIIQTRLIQEQLSFENLLISQINVQNNLNHLLGKSADMEIYVEFERELPEIPEDITSHIEALAAQAPNIRQMQFNVYRRSEDLARHLDIYRQRGIRPPRDCETCEELHEALDRVNLERGIVIRAMETALRSAYSNLEQLQTQENAARVALAQAEENLQTAIINFDLGRVTQFEITLAELEIFYAQQAIERILNQQWGLVLGLGNPVLL